MSSNNGKKIEAVYNAISNMQSALNGLQRALLDLQGGQCDYCRVHRDKELAKGARFCERCGRRLTDQ